MIPKDIKLSELLEVALRDLESCENDPNYNIHMLSWHYLRGEKCMVCLAGAVLAKSCQFNKGIRVTHPSDISTLIDPFTRDMMIVLDLFRDSYWGYVASCLEDWRESGWTGRIPWNLELPEYEDYHSAPEAFKARIRSIIDMLREQGC